MIKRVSFLDQEFTLIACGTALRKKHHLEEKLLANDGALPSVASLVNLILRGPIVKDTRTY